MEVYPPSVSDF